MFEHRFTSLPDSMYRPEFSEKIIGAILSLKNCNAEWDQSAMKLINIITPFHQLRLSDMSLAPRTVHITPNLHPHPNNNSLLGPNRCVEHMINMKMLQPCMPHYAMC